MTGLPLHHVHSALAVLRVLHQTHPSMRVEQLWLDGVEWKPFCGSWTCSCATPTYRPCPEWMGMDGGRGERCPRCGWPEHRHGVRFRIDRVPRDPDVDDDPCPWRVQCSATRCREDHGSWWVSDQPTALASVARHAERWHR